MSNLSIEELRQGLDFTIDAAPRRGRSVMGWSGRTALRGADVYVADSFSILPGRLSPLGEEVIDDTTISLAIPAEDHTSQETLFADKITTSTTTVKADEPAAIPEFIEATATEVLTFDVLKQRGKREKTSKLNRFGMFTLKVVGASLIVMIAGGIRTEETTTTAVKSAALSEAVVSTPDTQTTITVSETTLPATTTFEATTTTTSPTTTAAETTISPTTVPPETAPTIAGTVPETTVPAPLSLTVQAENGRALDTMKGLRIGNLVLDETCTNVEIYVENSFDIQASANWPYMTAEALQKLSVYNDPNSGLTPTQRLALEEDIKMSGLKNGPDGTDGTGTGSPMFALNPLTELAPANCIPTMADTRATLPVAGSTLAVQNGGNADQYQAVADLLPEFAALPGGGKVTYIQGHRRTQSAAFNGLNKYQIGNTVTYTGDDGVSRKYGMVGTEKIPGDMKIDALVQHLGEEATGQDMLVLQACLPNSSERALYIFTLL